MLGSETPGVPSRVKAFALQSGLHYASPSKKCVQVLLPGTVEVKLFRNKVFVN